MVLKVGAPPAQLDLTSVDTVENDCSSGAQTANGQSFPSGLSCSAPRTSSSSTTSWTTNVYIVARNVDSIEATVGQSDRSTPGSVVRFRVVGDGRELATVDVAYGESKQIKASLSGVLRLELSVTTISSPADSYSSAYAIWGNPVVIGSPDAIDRLSKLGN
jgi:hypothetical protein